MNNVGVINSDGEVGSFLIERGCKPIYRNIVSVSEITAAVLDNEVAAVVIPAKIMSENWYFKKDNNNKAIHSSCTETDTIFTACEAIDIPCVVLLPNFVLKTACSWTLLGMEQVAKLHKAKIIRTSHVLFGFPIWYLELRFYLWLNKIH